MLKQFGRVAYVVISERISMSDMMDRYKSTGGIEGLKWDVIKGLDIKFDISRPIYSLQSEARISILGLSMSSIEKYVSWGGDATAFKSTNVIRVYAGYGDSMEDAECIFEGNIINAMPTMPPNVWLEIQARTLYVHTTMSFTKDPVEDIGIGRTAKLSTYIKRMCPLAGFDVDISSLPEDHADDIVTIPVYEKPTKIETMMSDLTKLCKSKNILFDQTLQDNGRPIITFEPLLHKDSYTPPKSICININKNTGMIGIPKMKFNQIEVTCLLNENAVQRTLKFVNVSSRFAFPGLYNWKGDRTDDIYNALFRIINIRFHGHLRGNEWYATYIAQRDWKEGDR